MSAPSVPSGIPRRRMLFLRLLFRYFPPRRSPLQYDAPQGRGCTASDLRPGWEGWLPSEESNNDCHPPGSEKGEGVSPGLSFFPGRADLCPVLCSPQAQGRSVVAHGGRRARRRPLSAYASVRGSEGRGGARLLPQVFERQVPPPRPVRHLRLRLLLLPQASGPCSALPMVHQGRALLLCAGHQPPTDSDPSDVLRRCTGGPDVPPVPPPSSRSSALRRPS
ncbi:hypothetical protein NDU88_010407 [Pleurodeles waltl]|uniref:Uncharacterized protein n=1 Tax=Pleurodeles waltl TaxID=8319 RepID=A0AAV7PY81_PLEWA|nr:hypothetical protein NDU88_010407 [Pleurodeles waltl]